ncbi:MAG: glycosyltransferase [Methylotetracoccus sp.]
MAEPQSGLTRITLVLPDLRTGGAQRVILMLAREFSAAGHRINIVAGQAEGGLLDEVPSSARLVDLHAARGGGQLGFAARFTYRLARYLRTEQPDAVLSTLTGTNIAVVMARLLSRSSTRVVLREAASPSAAGNRWRRMLRNWTYRHADHLIALTPRMRQELLALGTSPREGISAIPNPVDQPAIRSLGGAPCEHPWLTKHDRPVLIAVGRLIPEKDYPTLLRAFSVLQREHPARLLILGEGPERARLERLVAALNLGDTVQLLGHQPNPWAFMARCDLFVLSSRSEGYPNAVCEALALGLPVVATDYDGTVGATFGDRCRVTAPGNPTALADALRDVLDGNSGRCGSSKADPTLKSVVRSYLRVLLPAATDAS